MQTMDSLSLKLRQTRHQTLRPQPVIGLVEWADTYRFLSPESSSTPGRWKTDLVAPARGPMMAVTKPGVKKITIMACTQLMKTEFINNVVGYFVHQDPSPIIVMQPTVNLAKTWSKDRLDPMIRDTPVLAQLISRKKSRDAGNTLGHKQFVGGHITVIGSNSPSELASRPVRIICRDEVDKYEDNVEGDPSALIAERSATFWNRLDIGVCSPTIEGHSKIQKEYLQSNQGKFHVDCPYCGYNHFMIWDNVRFDNRDHTTARYQCPECETDWTEKDRLHAIKTAQDKPDGGYVFYAPHVKDHYGFHVNKLASPWEDLTVLVKKFIETGCGKDVPKFKTFVNTQLAETWVEKGEKPDHMRLYERRETYAPNKIPNDKVAFLTAGADVQKDRIEVEIVGWLRDKQSYSIDYRVIMGETHTETPWKELDKLINETWVTPSGRELQLRMLAVDSGFNTQHVYDWVRKQSPTRVRAVKGSDTQQTIFGQPKDIDLNRDGSKLRRSSKVWPVGSSVVKDELYSWLKMSGAGEDGVYPLGFCHYPQYDEEYFKRLCSEQLETKKVNGRTIRQWVKIYERNEALDCRVYARAAASMFGIDRFSNNDWDMLEGKFDVPTTKTPEAEVNTGYVKPEVTRKKEYENKSDFWARQNQKKFW